MTTDRPRTPPGWVLPLAVGLLALAPRAWELDRNGTGNPYYAAAARSMAADPANFFFNAFDPGGFITVDKPPVAQWVQAASVRLFGFGPWSLLLPQAVMGAAACGVLTHVVRRSFGVAAGLTAGLSLALSPVNVAVDRVNLPDTALVLALLLAAWALLVAVESRRATPLLVALALVGLGFNVKMLAAFVVLPTFYAVYLLFADDSPARRVGRLAVGSGVLAAVSVAWMLAVDLTPPDRRPYVGGSRDNTVRDLVLGYNGLGRLTGGDGNGPPGGMAGGPPPGLTPSFPPDLGDLPFPPPGDGDGPPDFPFPQPGMGGPGGGMPFPFPPPGMDAGGGPPGPMMTGGRPGGSRRPGGPGGMMGGFGGEPGWSRLGNRELAGQATWLIPFATVGAVAAALTWWDRRRLAGVALWAGWLATHAVVFSTAKGTFHPYYLSMLAPAVAALTGVGLAVGLDGVRARTWPAVAMILGTVLTAAWQGHVLTGHPDWTAWLGRAAWAGAGVAAVGVAQGWRWDRRGAAATSLAVGVALLHAAPTAWSWTAVRGKLSGVMPAADPALLDPAGPRMGPPGGDDAPPDEKLVAFLQANHTGERYALIAPSAMLAAPFIIAADVPVAAAGGFLGTDPALTADKLAALVAAGQVRFVLVPSMPGPFGGGGEWAAWVKANGKKVDPKRWQSDTPAAPGPGAMMARMASLYDLRPTK